MVRMKLKALYKKVTSYVVADEGSVRSITLPSGCTSVQTEIRWKKNRLSNRLWLCGVVVFNITAGTSGSTLDADLGIRVTPPSTAQRYFIGTAPAFTWNAATGSINAMQYIYLDIDTSGKVSLYSPNIYNNSGVVTRMFITLPSISVNVGGGVLRNLSIFKAFGRFASSLFGGGVNGRITYKEDIQEDNRLAFGAADDRPHIFIRVRNAFGICWRRSFFDGYSSVRLYGFGSYIRMEHRGSGRVLLSRLLQLFGERRSLSIQRDKRDKKSRERSFAYALHKGSLALSGRRCAA